eukprot:CAMPEP_0204551900 /NCGR_PEP_ID=MMETSP0661-20131031/26242_1 /ASSEMBLY_ACC=CAM_ASM_000606 /TAXON_ID=109239 /ORGANISM="Alexandrium margalefi, Strain AMGDE01CS-322" /LENGTH=37 /DNA_ID= /DNA_START= /DNA_END= /DNA_ORIENTATION=
MPPLARARARGDLAEKAHAAATTYFAGRVCTEHRLHA